MRYSEDPEEKTLIQLRGLQVVGDRSNQEKKVILREINLDITPHQIVGIVGPSGAGKTTLLKTIALLNEFRVDGSYKFDQTAVLPSSQKGFVEKIRKNLVFIHQTPVLFKGNVRYNIEYGYKLRKMEKDQEYIDFLLESFKLSHILDQNVKTLSGGEQQRVCLLRAMAIKPRVLLLDEPTQNLDPANITIIEENIKKYCEDYKGTVIIVTHNLFQAKRITNELGILVNGSMVEYGSTKELFSQPKNKVTADFLTGKSVF